VELWGVSDNFLIKNYTTGELGCYARLLCAVKKYNLHWRGFTDIMLMY
jgi:hypothetical protein